MTKQSDTLKKPAETVVGIDVGGAAKGFHAVALRGNTFVQTTDSDPAVIVAWCLHHSAAVVAVDAPCKWSRAGSSRLAERELGKQGIHCFATPTRERAEKNVKGFYDWVFNGEWLYGLLIKHYPLFNGERWKAPTCIETFPYAIVCALAGRVVPARPKVKKRRAALQNRGYDDGGLPNIDFVDAALCAVAAYEFRKDKYQPYGDSEEGFIIAPRQCIKNQWKKER